MKNYKCIFLLSFFGLLSLFAEDFQTHKGLVSKTTISVTKLYKVGAISVARGSVKHVSDFVGKTVSIVCVIKKDKIVKIKSVTEEETTKSPFIDILTLRQNYMNSSSKTIKEFRNKALQYTGVVTTINNKVGAEYTITLSKGLGRVFVSKADMSKGLREKLWSLRLRENKNSQITITFTGEWYANQANVLLFRNIKDLK